MKKSSNIRTAQISCRMNNHHKSMEGLQHLANLALTALREKHPSVPAHAVPRPKYEDRTANGLTKCIIHFIRLTNGFAERVNSTGRRWKVNGRDKWIPTAGTRGTADIHALKHGRSVLIEVKVGKDKQSQKQKQYQQQIEQAGGVYVIARSFEQFVEAWNRV